MKILLTGHLGYLGTQFLQRYASSFEIVGYDLIEGDNILDYDNLKQKMQGCDQVVHLAAIPKPIEGKSFDDYFQINVEGTRNVTRAAKELGLTRVVYASSTTVYGIEQGIPFSLPIKEDQPFVSQYLSADQLSCRDIDLSYHMSKVMAEQIMAWYGLNKKLQTVALRFGPIGKVFLGTSVSDANAAQAIKLAIESDKELWYEPFSIVDELDHIDISKAKQILGYSPERFDYPTEKIRSGLEDRTIITESRSMKQIEQTYTIKAPVSEVWKALTDGPMAEQWGAGPAKVDAREGGEFSYWDGDIHGIFTKLVPNTLIEQDWYGHDNPTWKYTVTFAFEEDNEVTRVHMVYSGNILDEQKDIADWQECYFDPIKKLLEQE